MLSKKNFKHLRITIFLVLLGIIISRLVSMQLRKYYMYGHDIMQGAINTTFFHNWGVCSADPIPLINKTLSSCVKSFGLFIYTNLGCHFDYFSIERLLHINQAFLILTIFLMALLIRFITTSWLFSIIVVAALLSRGRLIATLEDLSLHGPIYFLITLTITSWAHFFRTGSKLGLYFAIIASLGSVLCDFSLIAVPFTVPILFFLFLLTRRRLGASLIKHIRLLNRQKRFHSKQKTIPTHPLHEEQTSILSLLMTPINIIINLNLTNSKDDLEDDTVNYQTPPSALLPLPVPFILWINKRKRWKRLLSMSFVWIFCCIAVFLLSKVFICQQFYGSDSWNHIKYIHINGYLNWFPFWIKATAQWIDFHLGLSLVIILFSACLSPPLTTEGFFETTWFFIILCITLTLTTSIAEYLDYVQYFASFPNADSLSIHEFVSTSLTRPFMLWVEPIALSLGIAGIYNLVIAIHTRLMRFPS